MTCAWRRPPRGPAARRSGRRALDGCGRRTGLPRALADYVALVRAFNERGGAADAGLRFYPGSPWLAALARRPQDRLVLWEQQPAEVRALRRQFARARRVAVECGDGYAAPRAALPPPERRALVLLDPPFESPDEFGAILRALREGLQRFPSGVYAVWYPVTERARVTAFQTALRALRPPPTLTVELAVTADPQVRMKGCGLLIINPPWRVADELQPVLPALAQRLGVDSGAAARCAWLVPET